MVQTLHDRIRERSYFLSQRGGGVDDGTHFWLIAEREVLAEVATESAATSQPVEVIRSPETAEPRAGLQVPETPQQPATEQPKKAVRKPRAAVKRSAKTPPKVTPSAVAECPATEAAVVTPLKPATKTRARAPFRFG